jgi:hypothetical protein
VELLLAICNDLMLLVEGQMWHLFSSKKQSEGYIAAAGAVITLLALGIEPTAQILLDCKRMYLELNGAFVLLSHAARE